MYNKNHYIKIPASRPVCWPEPAGLYAGVGRSLCRHRPVSMPASAGLYAGIYAGMGPRGLGPNPFSTVSQNSFFRDFGRPKN